MDERIIGEITTNIQWLKDSYKKQEESIRLLHEKLDAKNDKYVATVIKWSVGISASVTSLGLIISKFF